MPSYAELSAASMKNAEMLFLLADILDNTQENEEEEEDWELGSLDAADLSQDMYSELLELEGINWLKIAARISGEGVRGEYDKIPKSADFFLVALQAPDRWFRHMFRMSRGTFEKIVARIQDDPIFQSSRRPQRPVPYQLGCFLARYGQPGSDSLDIAQKLSIGHGTVFLYCRRIAKALRKLKHQAVKIPDEERQQEISDYIEEKSGFPGCIGNGDGCMVYFSEMPSVEGETYMNRKRRFATNFQATTDHEDRFTSYEIGYPGSVADVTIFKRSFIWKHRHEVFKEGRYILMDKGYPSSPYVVRPFDEVELSKAAAADLPRMKQFNKCLSSVRIGVEHTFGKLKARFRSLRYLPPHQNMLDTYKAIEAILILHNLCIDYGDSPESFNISNSMLAHGSDEDGEDNDTGGEDPDELPLFAEPSIPGHETDAWLKERGREKRMMLLNYLYPA